MLIDLGRNDVGRVSATGSVRVTEQMVIERYSHVMHLVSHVEGALADGKTWRDVLRAAFPAGTLSGAPKIRAMEIIDELEPHRARPLRRRGRLRLVHRQHRPGDRDPHAGHHRRHHPRPGRRRRRRRLRPDGRVGRDDEQGAGGPARGRDGRPAGGVLMLLLIAFQEGLSPGLPPPGSCPRRGPHPRRVHSTRANGAGASFHGRTCGDAAHR
jgi:hypothetical protein